VANVTLLNRHGRDTLLGDDASRSHVVQCLGDFHEDDDTLMENNPAMILSVLFGLLSLDPTIWSDATTHMTTPSTRAL